MGKIYNHTHMACRKLWVQATTGPIHLEFGSPGEATRAKFTLYDSVRIERKTGAGDPAIIEAVRVVEIATAPGKCGLILRPRATNTLHQTLCAKVAEVLGAAAAEGGEAVPAPTVDEVAAESLRRLMENLESGAVVGEPAAGLTPTTAGHNQPRPWVLTPN